jgi:orotate phosphoribosyltransferase
VDDADSKTTPDAPAERANGSGLVSRKPAPPAGQVIESTHALRQLGACITHALCVIDRESGGAERLADIGVTLISLFRASELKAAVQDT